MKFDDLATKLQEEVIALIDEHLTIISNLLVTDKSIQPMMLVAENSGEKKLMGFQPMNGNQDVDVAYQRAISNLKKIKDLHLAVFCYTTRFGIPDGKIIDAVKNVVFTADGLAITFVTPYIRKGLFKKQVFFDETVCFGIEENVFNSLTE